MKLKKEYKDLIVNEFKEILELCQNTGRLEDKLYFFSGAYGVLNRVMNFNCDPTLIFIYNVLVESHRTLSGRMKAQNFTGTIYNSLPDEFVDAVFTNFESLISAIEEEDENAIRKILEKLSTISFATTGNGFFLYLREKLII